MGALIIDDGGDTLPGRDFPNVGEAALYAAEFGKTGLYGCIVNPHMQRNADGSHVVEHIVAARHRHFDTVDPTDRTVTLTDLHIEAIAAGDWLLILAAHIRTTSEEPQYIIPSTMPHS